MRVQGDASLARSSVLGEPLNTGGRENAQGREMQPTANSEKTSAEWWCCAFSALRFGFVRLAFMLFGCSQAITADRSTKWPDNFGALKFAIV